MKNRIRDGDYLLKDGAAWIEVNGIAFRILGRGRNKATIEAYVSGKEMEDSISMSYQIASEGKKTRKLIMI